MSRLVTGSENRLESDESDLRDVQAAPWLTTPEASGLPGDGERDVPSEVVFPEHFPELLECHDVTEQPRGRELQPDPLPERLPR